VGTYEDSPYPAATFIGCTFFNNTAGGGGGAIAVYQGKYAVVIGCKFAGGASMLTDSIMRLNGMDDAPIPGHRIVPAGRVTFQCPRNTSSGCNSSSFIQDMGLLSVDSSSPTFEQISDVKSAVECCAFCQAAASRGCVAWVWQRSNDYCWLDSAAATTPVPMQGAVSGLGPSVAWTQMHELALLAKQLPPMRDVVQCNASTPATYEVSGAGDSGCNGLYNLSHSFGRDLGVPAYEKISSDDGAHYVYRQNGVWRVADGTRVLYYIAKKHGAHTPPAGNGAWAGAADIGCPRCVGLAPPPVLAQGPSPYTLRTPLQV
jgi:predicted outer membrane repeat protein